MIISFKRERMFHLLKTIYIIPKSDIINDKNDIEMISLMIKMIKMI